MGCCGYFGEVEIVVANLSKGREEEGIQKWLVLTVPYI
jgi:hypothetical protein